MVIDTPLIARLRDHLLDLSAHSILPRNGTQRALVESPEERAVMDRFRPFAELFYLVAAADGEVDEEERQLILGAFRALTGGSVRKERLMELSEELRLLRESQSVYDRLEIICSEIANNRQDADLAFTLASAVAVANKEVSDTEQELLDTLASWLGIRDSRAKILVAESRNSIMPSPSLS